MNVKMIRDSFAVAAPIGDQVVDKFYALLFQDYPQSKPLFKGVDMSKQRRALLGALSFAVGSLEDLPKLTSVLTAMGARHAGYGVKDEHYDWVGKTLLKTFSFFFKDKWTRELEKEWAGVYGFIAKTMQDGARQAEREQGGGRKAA